MSSTACPSSSSPAVTIRATITTCRYRSYGGHDEPVRSDTPAEPQISAVRGGASLVNQLTCRPEELRVQVPAADAGQPASGLGEPVGRIDGQRVVAVFAADRYGDDGDYPHHHTRDEDSDGDDYDTGHDGLPHFRPA